MPNEFGSRLLTAAGDANDEIGRLESAIDIKDQALAQVRAALATAVALGEAQAATITVLHARVADLEALLPEPEFPPTITGCDTMGPEPSYFTDWKGSRHYRLGEVATVYAATKPRIIAITDDRNTSRTGGAATVSKFRAMLDTWPSPDCEAHVANGNEVDREWQTGTPPAAYFDTCEQLAAMIHETTAGVRVYPFASHWVDLTTWQIQTADVLNRWRPIAPTLDGVASSLYNPGRHSDPVKWTPYADYVDETLDLVAEWGVKQYSIWETGSPVGMTPTQRPFYFEDLLDYTAEACRVRGIAFRAALYWNRQKAEAGAPANQFKHDRGLAPNDTATVWHNWTPTSVE